MTKKPIKVAVLSTPVGYGGAEKVILSLIENINAEQYELVPIVFTRPDQIDNNFIKRLRKLKKEYHELSVSNHKIKYLNPLVNFIDAYRLLGREKFNLMHTHGYRADVLGFFISKLIGLPIISTCHGYILNDLNLIIYKNLDQFVLRFFDTVITVSERMKLDLIRSGVKEPKIKIITNAVAINPGNIIFMQNGHVKRQLFGIGPKDFVIGYIGRLSDEKGVRYLIEASFILSKLDVPLRVLLIGDGPSRRNLELLVKQKGIECIVVFAGFQSDVENLLSVIDVLVLPSLTEGTPMALLEAMSYGVPVVASAVGEVPNIIDSGKNGILIPPANPEKIAEAVLTIWRDNDFRTKISERAKDTIQCNFNINNWIKKIESVYAETISKRNAGLKNIV